MYFPYLRGKQFELIALRELSAVIGERKISPIIEPVKSRTSGLNRAIASLVEANSNFTIIVNPRVGELRNRHREVINGVNQMIPASYSNFQFGIIIDETNDAELIRGLLEDLERDNKRLTLIHFIRKPENQELVPFDQFEIVFNIIESSLRRYPRKFDTQTVALLDDPFTTLDRNADYLELGEETFSEEHAYFREDGFAGYADYGPIGSTWSEGGFQPYAVVIHLTYLVNNIFKIRHFTSESNEDADDVANKFREANLKLNGFISQNHIDTIATREFSDLHQRMHYPGLGTIKKLSIMNHLELVNSVI